MVHRLTNSKGTSENRANMTFSANKGSHPAERRRETVEPERAKILVVDDDPPTRDSLCELHSDRYDVRAARDCAEGVEAARADTPDLILMDVYMPGTDGLTAHKRLLRYASTASSPVI